jgi:hypothetical protein
MLASLTRRQRLHRSTVRNSTLAPGSLSVTRSTRETADAAAAAKPENRQPLYRRRQFESVQELGVEARNSKAGDGVDDDGPDVAELKARGRGCFSGDPFEQLCRVLQEALGASRPSMLLVVPVGGLAGITGLDAGIAKQGAMPVQLGKDVAGTTSRILLRKAMPRHRSRHAGDSDVEALRRYNR